MLRSRACSGLALTVLFAAVLAPSQATAAGREAVLKQVDLPHSYYWRELYLPQLTAGPSSLAFMPDGQSLVYAMGGSLWRQRIGEGVAVELTHPEGAYDHQPDVARDGGSVVFARYDGAGIELWRLDISSGQEQRLTSGAAVNVEPRISPDGRRLAWVSTQGTGHFNLWIAELDAKGLGNARMLLGERRSTLDRYYYSAVDHAINPAWSADGREIFYVGNPEVAWGTGEVRAVEVDSPTKSRVVVAEETSWAASPEPAPAGKRLLYASYRGRQWHQLWLARTDGGLPLPLTFGDFDRRRARWSPDGTRVAYISNEGGPTGLVVQDVVGGATQPVVARERRWLRPHGRLVVDVVDESGQRVPARVSVDASDGRAYAPAEAWLHADDGFDRSRQRFESHYFHCAPPCSLDVPAGAARVRVWRGFAHLPVELQPSVTANGETRALATLRAQRLPAAFGEFVSADLHVHMNYGGHYRNTPERLAAQARAEDLDVVYNLIVNKEERIPDIGYFRAGGGADPAAGEGVTVFHAQEYHTSFWGHLGLLHLDSHVLTPDFSSYRHTGLASPYPHNGTIAALARAQGGIVGYVHPFDWSIDPAREKTLTNQLPADAILGNVDYLEVVAFSDHKATAEVWYRLLNLGLRIPAGAGTDAMANYASLRGPVGLNRVFLDTGSKRDPATLREAIKGGRGFVSNAPLLGLTLDDAKPGDTARVERGHPHALRVAMRSPVPIDHLELVRNGEVLRSYLLKGDRRSFDASEEIELGEEPGWLLLRAWNDGADPLVLDLYPYASTNPVYLEATTPQPAISPRAEADAAYFVAWLDRVIESASAREDWNDDRERKATLAELERARAAYRALQASGRRATLTTAP